MSDFSSVAPSANFNQSSAYAAALQKAKQIAAKINPPEAGTKRELEEPYQPEPKKVAHLEQGGTTGAKRGPPGMAPDQIYEEISVPDKIVGLIIGKAGEQISRMQAESGCKIQMERSRGTSERQCQLTGSREAINRAKEMVMNIVNQFNRGDQYGGLGPPGVEQPPPPQQNFQPSNGGGPQQPFEIMIPGPKVGLIIGKGGETIKQLQEQSGAKMMVIQDNTTQDFEKPLRITGTPQQVEHAKDLVYQLIADKEMGGDRRGGNRGGGGQGGGGGGGGGGPHFGGNQGGGYNNYDNNYDNGSHSNMVEILVPRAAVGVVIGKGGDMIKKIQNETGARLQFEQGRDDGPGDRKCIVSGNPEQTQEAKQRVDELIDSVLRRDNDNGRGREGGNRGGPGGGRGRENDRRGGDYNERGGGRSNSGGGGSGDRWGNRGGQGPGSNDKSITFSVPANRAGFVIGRGGETIKSINHQTGAHCEIDRKLSGVNPAEKVFVIRGSPEQIEEAKRLIIEKSGVQINIQDDYYSNSNQGSNPSPMGQITSTAYPNQGGFQQQGWGGPGAFQWGGAVPNQAGPPDNANQQQVPINPVSGQPDYTLQWAEYYRSLGMVKEAEMIEQQAKANKGMGPQGAPMGPNPGMPAPAQPQQPGGQVDYSAQWAEYYRSIGKMKEAEAVEAQMKAKASQVGGGGPPVSSQPMPQPQQPGYNQFAGYQPQPQNNLGYYGGGGVAPPPGGYQGGYGGYGQPGGE